MTRTTIQQETINVLSHPALTSPRAHYVSEAIKNSESSFEIIRILTSALIAADQEAEIYKKQCINLSQNNTVIPPMILDRNQIFMGVDIAKEKSDYGICWNYENHDSINKQLDEWVGILQNPIATKITEWLKKNLGDKYSNDIDTIFIGAKGKDTIIGKYSIHFSKDVNGIQVCNSYDFSMKPFNIIDDPISTI